MLKLYGACVQTKNIADMVEFYSALFGKAPNVSGADYRFPGEQLIIYKLPDGENCPTENMSVIYQVECANDFYAELQGKNFAVSEPPTDKPWGVCSFLLKDPDGNTVSIFNKL